MKWIRYCCLVVLLLASCTAVKPDSSTSGADNGETSTEEAFTGEIQTQVSEKDGMNMVYVPAGKFTMGTTEEIAAAQCSKYGSMCERMWYRIEAPPHKVKLDAFWIDQTEVTNAMYIQCINAGVCTEPHMMEYMSAPFYDMAEIENHPVVLVDWQQAEAYCNWAGRRLPTEAEWEKAARGTDERTFPWGNTDPDDTLANFNRIVENTTPVGSYPTGISPYGAYDMAGNVLEWVADGFSYYSSDNQTNPTGNQNGDERIFRGGSWGDDAAGLRTTYRNHTAPDFYDISVGFRCAASAEE